MSVINVIPSNLLKDSPYYNYLLESLASARGIVIGIIDSENKKMIYDSNITPMEKAFFGNLFINDALKEDED